MSMIWSSDKEEVFRFEQNFCVSAGAGSGKTATLVELYLRFLKKNLEAYPRESSSEADACTVSNIVAITFTEKAAAEMKMRLREAIEKEILRTAQANDRIKSSFWKDQKNYFGLSYISTFHSFCRRILREYPVEAGVDPNFSVLAEEEANQMLKEITEEVMIETLDLAIENPNHAIASLIRTFGLRGFAYTEGLIDFLQQLASKIFNAGFTIEEVARMTKTFVTEASLKDSKTKLIDLLKQLKDLASKPGGTSATQKRAEEIENLWAQIQDAGLTEELIEAVRAATQRVWGTGQTKEVRASVALQAQQLQAEIAEQEAQKLAQEFLILLKKICDRYEERKASHGKLDFNDLQLKARDLLRDEPSVRNEYKKRFKRIMVDEFQDTNRLQKEIVYFLAEDPESCARISPHEQNSPQICLAPRKLFLVGDPKQSIYGFRGADVSVFKKVMEEMEESRSGKVIYFSENFRSQPSILTFVNRFFSDLMQASSEHYDFQIQFHKQDELWAQRPEATQGPKVELIDLSDGNPCGEEEDQETETLPPKIKLNASEQRKREAQEIGKRILALVYGSEILPVSGNEHALRKPRYEDIAILFRRFTKVKIYEQTLRKMQIPYYAVKGSGFFQCQEIYDLLNFLKIILYPKDNVALAGVLRSPLVGISDETLFWLVHPENHPQIPLYQGFLCQSDDPCAFLKQNRLDESDQKQLIRFQSLWQRFRQIKDGLPLAELLEEIVEQTGFSSALLATFQGEQRVANLRKLIEMARDFESQKTNNFVDFVHHLDRLVQENPRESEAQVHTEVSGVVRLMTIHQAKGLEFPIVFLPDMGQEIGKVLSQMFFDEEKGLVITKVNKEHGGTLHSQRFKERERTKEIAESQRIFYVASTRARDYLILSGEKQKHKALSWRLWLDEFIVKCPGLIQISKGFDPPNPNIKPVLCEAISEIREFRKVPIHSLIEVTQNQTDTNIEQQVAAQAEKVLRNALYTVRPPATAVTLTVTSLNDYLNCPRRFYYLYRTGIPEYPRKIRMTPRQPLPPSTSAWEVEDPLDAQTQGILAHKILEKIDFFCPPARFSAEIDELFRGQGYSPLRPDIQEIKQNVLAFLQSDFGRYLRSLKPEAIKREIPFLLSLCDQSTGMTIYIKGIIDMLYHDSDRYTVIDYKHMLPGENKDKVESYRPQVWIYSLAVSKWQPAGVIQTAIKFLKDKTASPVDVTPSLTDLKAFERRIISVIKEIGWMDRDNQYVRLTQQDSEARWKKIDPKRCITLECGFIQRCHPEVFLNSNALKE